MSPGRISRVTVDLAVQQNEDAGCHGRDRQDNGQAADRDEGGQARVNEPDGQQDENQRRLSGFKSLIRRQRSRQFVVSPRAFNLGDVDAYRCQP
jgi:hypothetical protein